MNNTITVAAVTTVITVFDALLDALAKAASAYNRQEEVPPCVVLWTDKDAQWQPLLPRLRAALPGIYTLGDYAPDQRTGPAIWLRYVLDATGVMTPSVSPIVAPDSPKHALSVPIFYLPGVSRSELRAVESCPKPWQPLAELQYRGAFWTQVNGKDWTVGAFLQSNDGGLGLEVARDANTQEAMRRAMLKLADEPVAALQGRRLTTSDFDDLLSDDLPAQVLAWLNAPQKIRQAWSDAEWGAFCSLCRAKLAFDPERDGELEGAKKLGERQGLWANVWKRFADVPRKYPALRGLLEQAKPMNLFLDGEVWPQDNAKLEQDLRDRLLQVQHLAPAEARQHVLSLEAPHAVRRDWVWAELGESPVAKALTHLAALASATGHQLGGDSVETCARAYADVDGGWRADAAAMDALASVQGAGRGVQAVVKMVVLALYRPWLRDSAEHFQRLAQSRPWEAPKPVEPRDGTCLLFADGLRYDVAQKLARLLETEHQFKPNVTWRFAALPTITATAKPAVSPIVHDLSLHSAPNEFYPTVSDTGKTLDATTFRKLLTARGLQVLTGDECGDSTDPQHHAAWAEYRDLDKVGHDEGFKLAWRIDEHVRGLAERISTLLESGWREVVVVTDHGWLLLPDKLPKQPLATYLSLAKGRRCALLAENASPDTPVVAWHWNSDVQVAVTHGINVFVDPVEYSHGGVSAQECVVPLMHVAGAASAQAAVKIESVKWLGLRCRVSVSNGTMDMMAGIRTKAADATSSVAQPKQLDGVGNASLVVTDDRLEGTSAFVVILDAQGSVIARGQTVIGGSGE